MENLSICPFVCPFVCLSPLLILFLFQTLNSRNITQSTLITQPLSRYLIFPIHVSHARQSTGPPSQLTGPPMKMGSSYVSTWHPWLKVVGIQSFEFLCKLPYTKCLGDHDKPFKALCHVTCCNRRRFPALDIPSKIPIFSVKWFHDFGILLIISSIFSSTFKNYF